MLMIAAAEMSPAVRRASAIRAAAQLVEELQEWIPPEVAPIALEAWAALMEGQELGQSGLPRHPNQIRTGERKAADMQQEKHKSAIGSLFRHTELPRRNRSRTSLCTRSWQRKY
jgi:hypothetical protein